MMKRNKKFNLVVIALSILILGSCSLPPKKEAQLHTKHNYIVLLDLSDRLVVQENQSERDKQLIQHIYDEFEKKVRNSLYIKSRDELKVVVAPQRGANLRTEVFEDRMYINMVDIPMIKRKQEEKQRRTDFMANLDSLYREAKYSQTPEDYYGADIWKYFYEDLRVDYSKDTLVENYLFIITDGYPIVGKKQVKLQQVKEQFPNLHIVLLEASPRDKDMEWDRVMTIWENWFNEIEIDQYTMIKRGAISKEMEQIEGVIKGT
ncbi:MAG: hypothetical protein ACFHWX_13805 [Bacteroidota bacterium]